MSEAFAIGIPPWRFYDMTYRELYNAFAGYAERARRQRKDLLFAAWSTANFERAKRLPNLVDVLRKLDPPRIMSNKDLRAAIVGVARALGAKVVDHRKEGGD